MATSSQIIMNSSSFQNPSTNLGQPQEPSQIHFSDKLTDSTIEDVDIIRISVCDPLIRDGLQKYVVYTVKGMDKNGSFEIQRRFNDFYSLRQILSIRWPGVYIPALPPKKAVGNMDTQFIEERCQGLDRFMQNIVKKPYLYYAEETKIFLRSTLPDVDKTILSLRRLSYEELINKYSIHFYYLSGKYITSELIVSITSLSGFLKRSQLMLENFLNMTKNLVEARNQFNSQHNLFLSYIMPEFEKNCIAGYIEENGPQSLIDNEQDPLINQAATNLKQLSQENPYNSLSLFIRSEMEEIECMLEAIQKREQCIELNQKTIERLREEQVELQKVYAGKSSGGSFFSRKTKEQTIYEIDLKIKQMQKEVNDLTLICDIITFVQGYVEIENFKKERRTNFYKILDLIGKMEEDQNTQIITLWSQVVKNQYLRQTLDGEKHEEQTLSKVEEEQEEEIKNDNTNL